MQPPLIGREREIAALVATLETAGAGGGQGQALLFAGEPGIGKTRLLDVAAGEARARGMDVAWGTAWSGAPAYWPLVQALRGLGLDEAAARLWEPGRVPVDAGDHRFRLAAAVADALRSRRPTLILLDDLHDADRATLELVGLAIRASRGARVAWIGAYRRGEALAGGVGEALAAIAREGTALSVPPLDETQVASLARARGRGDAERLYRRSLGNPLFVLELLEWPGGDDLPDTVREVIAQRQARLEPDARAALEAAAILGGELSLAALAGVLGVTVEAAASMARRASRLGFMIDEGGVRLRFGHPLFREAVQAGLPPDRRRALHAAAAQTLEALRANGVEIAAGEIAHHYAEAELAPQTIVWALRGADEESRRGAHDRAATLCERALAACDLGAVAPARRIDALIALAEARVRGGDRGRGREVALRAAELARAGRDGERLARAALAHAAEFEIGAVDARQVALLEEARAALPADSPLAARVLARLAAAMVPAIDSEVPLRLAREALASARRSLSEADRLEVMLAAGSTFAYAEPREKIALGEETAALALALGERGAALRVHARLVLDNLEGGEPAAAEAWLERHGALLAELPLPAHQGIGKLLLAATAAMRGRFSEAFAASDGAFAIARELGDPSLFRSWGIQRFALLAAAGTDEELRAYAAASGPAPDAVGAMAELVYQGVVQAEMGDLDGARATRARIALDSPLIAAELSVIAGAMELVAWIGDVEGARYLRRFLPRFAGRQVTTGRVGMMLVSPPERLEALLAHAQGDSRRALELIAGAIAAAERMGLPPIALRLLLDRARIQAAIGEPVAIDALVAEAARLGMPRVAAAAGALRREEPAFTLSRDGDVWRIARGPRSFLVKDSRGLGMLAALVAQPDREIHAIDLAHGPDVVDGGDAGELLDADAKAAYRRRLHELAEAREEAAGDPARLVQIEDEVDAIDRELRRAVGLGGRDRRAGAAAERARVNVQRRLRDALARIAEHDAELARHLEASLRTGTYCVYRSRPPG